MAKTPTPPYTSVSDIDAFFERVQTIAEPKPPKKVDSDWVRTFGFETAHPSAIPSMLRWLGVINDEAESTGVWNDLRVEAKRQATLGRLVKEAYNGVFETIDVEKASASDLRGAFVGVYEMGDPKRHIKCFLSLCQHAGIATAAEAPSARERESRTKQERERKATTPRAKPPKDRVEKRERQKTQQGAAVTVSLAVEVPAEWSEEQIRERMVAVARAVEDAGLGDS